MVSNNLPSLSLTVIWYQIWWTLKSTHKGWLPIVRVRTKFHKNGPIILKISKEENTLSPSQRKAIFPYIKQGEDAKI